MSKESMGHNEGAEGYFCHLTRKIVESCFPRTTQSRRELEIMEQQCSQFSGLQKGRATCILLTPTLWPLTPVKNLTFQWAEVKPYSGDPWDNYADFPIGKKTEKAWHFPNQNKFLKRSLCPHILSASVYYNFFSFILCIIICLMTILRNCLLKRWSRVSKMVQWVRCLLANKQACWPEYNPQKPQDERREQTPECCPLISTYMWWQMWK